LVKAKKRKVNIIATNAAHNSVFDLYKKEFELKALSRKSVIGSSASSRGRFDELFIRG